jgi:hypothetical protein
MPLIRITPEIEVDPHQVRSVRMDSETDAFSAKHVILDFENHSLEIPPEYIFDELIEALHGGCYYRPKYLDQAGTVDICVVHDDISEYPYTGNARDAYRRCVRNDYGAQMMKAFEAMKAQKNYTIQYYDDPKPPGFFSWFRSERTRHGKDK